MKAFNYLLALSFVMLQNCRMISNDKNISNNKSMTRETAETNQSRFSAKVLSGTCWRADYSDKDDEHYVMFTDSSMISVSILLGKTSKWEYPYYMTTYRSVEFDYDKVGGDSKGDYILYYDKFAERNKVSAEEIIWMSPTKLVTVSYPNDTISFTRKDWIEK